MAMPSAGRGIQRQAKGSCGVADVAGKNLGMAVHFGNPHRDKVNVSLL